MREYITTLLLVSIFSIVVSFILPDTKLKKYITVMIGIIVVSIIIEPIINFAKGDNVISTLSMKIEEMDAKLSKGNTIVANSELYSGDMVRQATEEKLEEDILNICISKGINVNDVEIVMTEEYLVSAINIYVSDSGYKEKKNTLINTITDKYSLEANYINIIKGE